MKNTMMLKICKNYLDVSIISSTFREIKKQNHMKNLIGLSLIALVLVVASCEKAEKLAPKGKNVEVKN